MVFRIHQSDETSLEQMLERIEQLEPSQRADRSSREAQPLYPWPLAAALLLSALWSSRPMRRRLHA